MKDKSLGEGIKSLVTDLQRKVPIKVVQEIDEFEVPKGIEDHLLELPKKRFPIRYDMLRGRK